MKENQHESGAHALLKLGTKRENDNDNEAAQNNHINDAVEAAVMKYVGGTLGSHDSKRRENMMLTIMHLLNGQVFLMITL